MVAVYFDDKAVGTLRGLYPDAREARLRKVVLEYGPSEKERNVYEPLFGGTAMVKVGAGEESRMVVGNLSQGLERVSCVFASVT